MVQEWRGCLALVAAGASSALVGGGVLQQAGELVLHLRPLPLHAGGVAWAVAAAAIALRRVADSAQKREPQRDARRKPVAVIACLRGAYQQGAHRPAQRQESARETDAAAGRPRASALNL